MFRALSSKNFAIVFSLKVLKPKCTGSTRPQSAYWANHMPLCLTTYKVPQNYNFFLQVNNLINLLNRKLEIRHTRLFLSDDDGLVVLPDRLRPAAPIDFIPPTSLRPIFCLASALRPAVYITRSISPSHRAPLPYFLLPIALSIFYQRRRCLWRYKLNFTFGLGVNGANNQLHSLNLTTTQPHPPQPR
jgi:hypothetical protein